MKKLFAGAAMALSLLAITDAANAAPIQWTLSEVTFDDGGIASGSFVYDADSNVYSNILLKTTAGSAGTAAEYRTRCTTAHCLASLPELLFIASASQSDLTNVPILDIEPSAPLTNTPGTVDMAFGMSFLCSNATCNRVGSGLRAAFSGKLVGTPYIAPTPTPTGVPSLSQWSVAMLTLVLAAIAACLCRRRSW